MTFIDVYIIGELKSAIILSMTNYLVKIKADGDQLLQIHDSENYNKAAILLNNLTNLLPIDSSNFESVIIPMISTKLETLVLPQSMYPASTLNSPTVEEVVYENKKQIIYILNYYNTNTINKL